MQIVLPFGLGTTLSLASFKITPLQRFSANVFSNILAALWMLAGSRRAFTYIKPTAVQFSLFAISALSANVLFSWLVADQGSKFNEQGLVAYLVWPMIMVLAGVILARRTTNDALTFIPAILWLTADTLFVLLQSGVQFFVLKNWVPDWSYTTLQSIFTLLFVWQTVGLLWIFAKKMQWSWWEQALMLFGAIVLLVVWQRNIIQNQPIFQLIPEPPSISESDFYKQPKLLDDALAGLKKGTKGVTEWYFVGVAGNASEDVFTNEIKDVRQLFDVRFGTSGRSIALINNRNTWQDTPIATTTSIAEAIHKVGETMNTEEDVLFLTLTSHGGDNVLELSNTPIKMENLSAAKLRQILDESGIRWSVIVISACYSGSFIDELSSPTTMIITASKADKASFGCGNTEVLTYFGQAFFAEAMRTHTSFAEAFQAAKLRIAEREALNGFEPSEPQMVVGDLMLSALPDFEKALFLKKTAASYDAKSNEQSINKSHSSQNRSANILH